MALNINGTTGISGVDGSVSTPALKGTDSNTGITFPSADTIKFATGGVERMAITNSGVSGITAGITMADQWRITSSFSGSAGAYLTANWARVNSDGFGQLGTGMTQSSGVFTFPSSGIYQVHFHTSSYRIDGSMNEVNSRIDTTINDSDYNDAVRGITSFHQGGSGIATVGSSDCFFIFDVTNETDCKVKFHVSANDANATFDGNAGSNRTYATFIRLGDT